MSRRSLSPKSGETSGIIGDDGLFNVRGQRGILATSDNPDLQTGTAHGGTGNELQHTLVRKDIPPDQDLARPCRILSP